jgi:hypothetical protein
MNKNSYRYEMIKTNEGMFDNYIDIIYILTMENSKRRDHYMKQINIHKPHKKILIQHNKGFKKCEKKLYKQNSLYDLNDAYYHVFLNALQNNYKNIIIFEDDFFFDETINKYIVDDIGNFITTNKYHVYNLGNLYGFPVPSFSTHTKNFLFICSHGAIYNIDYFNYYINKYEKNMKYANDLIWNSLNIIKYNYYKPLCFQLFGPTDNKNLWATGKIFVTLMNFLKMDITHIPGFNFLNIASFISSFIIIYIVINILLLLVSIIS